jgi:drug/metabolite transporter (DMT)-like permease
MTPLSRGVLLAVLSSAGAACFVTTYKLAAARGGAADAVFVMIVFAAAFNTLVSGAQSAGRDLRHLGRLSLILALALSTLTLAGNRLAVEALTRISAPLTSVMQQTQVFFVAVLGGVLLGESVTARYWVGATVAVIGLGILHLAPETVTTLDLLGTALAAGSAACFALMAVLTRKYIHRIRPVPVNALRLWMTVVLWFVVEGRWPRLEVMSPAFVAYCAAAALFGPFLSRVALMYALRSLRPSETSLVALATPLFTLPLALVAFGAIPSARELVGSAIMLAGIALPLLALRAQGGRSGVTQGAAG